ncbi:MAG: hypothetical protein DWH80_07220 [Planctomycetota bacterium]|nr:MAG: hypothetical protein DWH72_00650 [Planctomycetota bacterium]RLS31258.1 MAG: hypothetical protein DWH80_07220 [Planctomycetota bacterium]
MRDPCSGRKGISREGFDYADRSLAKKENFCKHRFCLGIGMTFQSRSTIVRKAIEKQSKREGFSCKTWTL